MWLRMASRYGHTWTSQFGVAPEGFAGAEWRSTLRGLSRDQVRDGFATDLLRGADWPPSSTRFRAMCLGIPAISEVRHRVTKDSSDRFVRLMWCYINGYDFARVQTKDADRMVEEAYAIASRHVMEGGPLPAAPVAAIESKPRARKRATAETERSVMAGLADFLSAGAST
jgi:hypothetical protein